MATEYWTNAINEIRESQGLADEDTEDEIDGNDSEFDDQDSNNNGQGSSHQPNLLLHLSMYRLNFHGSFSATSSRI